MINILILSTILTECQCSNLAESLSKLKLDRSNRSQSPVPGFDADTIKENTFQRNDDASKARYLAPYSMRVSCFRC